MTFAISLKNLFSKKVAYGPQDQSPTIWAKSGLKWLRLALITLHRRWYTSPLNISKIKPTLLSLLKWNEHTYARWMPGAKNGIVKRCQKVFLTKALPQLRLLCYLAIFLHHNFRRFLVGYTLIGMVIITITILSCRKIGAKSRSHTSQKSLGIRVAELL